MESVEVDHKAVEVWSNSAGVGRFYDWILVGSSYNRVFLIQNKNLKVFIKARYFPTNTILSVRCK